MKPQLSYCQIENIDIQCFFDINQNMSKHTHRKKFHDTVRLMDKLAKYEWSRNINLVVRGLCLSNPLQVELKKVVMTAKGNGVFKYLTRDQISIW